MKKLFFLLLFTWLWSITTWAQLTVAEECSLKEGDITAYRMNDQKPILIDSDTIPYAIVRVGLAEPNVVFDSRWVLKQEYVDNEYWVYFMEGVKSVTIKSKRFAPLHYRFPLALEAKNTYVMTLRKPDGDKYKSTLNVGSNIAKAQIYIDGVKVSDGTPFTYIGEAGPHKVELKADGYEPQERDVNLPTGQQTDITINLFKAGALSVDGVSYGMVPVEATTFTMGSSDYYYSTPPRRVSLRPFTVGSTFVSVALWEKVMGPADDLIKGPKGRVVNVSYDQILDFIAALNSKTGNEYRLPTEAEWEYVCRNSARLGVDDMGEMLEWCNDWFGIYTLDDSMNPQGPDSGIMRSVRGGSEYANEAYIYSQPFYRWHKQPHLYSPRIAFRLVQDI